MLNEWSTLRKLMFYSATASKLTDETVSGNPAAFETNVAKPLKSMLIPFTPVQTGSGDPSPSNIRSISGLSGIDVVRTGKNVFNKAYLSDPASYKNEASGYMYTDAIRLAPNTTYTISPSSTEQLETTNYYVLYINPSETDPDYLVITNPAVRYPVTAGKPKWIAFTTGATGVVRFGVYPSYLSVFMSVDWQLEVGETPTVYEPYVEPETCHIEFPAMGKNLLHVDDGLKLSFNTMYSNWTSENGVVTITGNATGGYIMPCKPGTQYSYSFDSTYIGDQLAARVYEFSEYPTVLSAGTLIVNDNTSTGRNVPPVKFTTTEAGRWLVVGFYGHHGAGNNITISNMQVELGSTATAYEPFDNTIYGGELNLTTGELAVTHIMVSSTWGDAYKSPPVAETGLTSGRLDFPEDVEQCTNQRKYGESTICSVSSTIVWGNATYTPMHYYINTTNIAWVAFPTDMDPDVYIQIIGKLKQPRTIQLDPVAIQALNGGNTIWTNTNGTNVIIYKKKG